MKEKTGLLITYTLFVITLFLPWFTYDSRIMGYCWGTQFVLYFLLPLAMVGAYLFSRKESAVLFVLAEIGAVFNLVFMVLILGTWQEARNIVSGFHWRDGLHTAMPTYWISLALSVSFFVLLQFKLLTNKEKRRSNVPVMIVSVVIGIIIFAVVIIAVAVNHVTVNYGVSDIYSQADMDAAIDMIKNEFNSWDGCKLYAIYYTDDALCKEEVAYCNTLAEDDVVYSECIVFRTRFRSPVFGGGAWNNNTVYDWSWYLAREQDGQWDLLTWGMP